MRRQEEALRIMEALSGVDEELLARCEAADTANIGDGTAASREEAGRPTGRKGKRNRHMWQYLGRCAAVLALVAVGAVSWKGLRVSKDRMTNESASGGSPEAVAMDFSFILELDEGLSADGAIPTPAEAESAANGAGGTGSADGAEITNGLDGTDDLDAIREEKSESCVTSAARMLTADEARQTDLLGSYVPTALPAGYAFESARYDETTGRLTIWWDKGMDNIILSFEQVDGSAVGTVDIRRPETYDERLYEIPFADTVPAEYRKVFSDPVFAKDDFSLEIVCSRMLSYSGDSGDTSTPRGQFSVLYDGVLVCFNGRGTPEEIWEMFSSISKQ